jgi:hypothetical protein
MAYTLTGYDGRGVARPLQNIGQFAPLVAFKVTISGTVTSQAIKVPGLSAIHGVIVQVIDTNGDVATADADISWSGNTLTIADGGATFNLDASGHSIYVIAWGKPRA